MISITTATADDLITLADIEQICFSSQESASLNTLKSRFDVFPNHFLVAKIHKHDDNEIIGFVNGMVTDEETITDEMYTIQMLNFINHKESIKQSLVLMYCHLINI